MPTRRNTSLLALAVAAVLGLSGPAPAAAQQMGGTLNFGRYADSMLLDPVMNENNVDIWILTNLYSGLLRPTDDGAGVVPALAESRSWAPDHLSVTFTLRPGIKFSDGSPITAGDVKWSLDRARNPDNGVWNFMLGSTSSIETEGADKVTLKLKNYDPTLEAALATFNASIMPEAAYEAAPGTTETEKAQAFSEHPVTSGPFTLASWTHGTDMVLKRNPNYYAKDDKGNPLPYLDEVHFEVIPDDATRILKLTSGEIDGTEMVPYSRVGELKKNPALNMELFPSTKITFLNFNSRPTVGDKPNPLADVRVRQALNYALNKDALIKIVTHGVAQPMQSYMATTTPLAMKNGPLYAYDMAKAKALIKEAGLPAGTELHILSLSGNQDFMQIATAAQQMFAPLGIKLVIEQLDKPTISARQKAHDFQIVVTTWTNDLADPSQLTSYMAYYPLIQSYRGGWQSKEVDALFEESQKEVDPARRAGEYATIQKIYTEAAPIGFLYESPYPVALSKKVNGFVQIPLGNNIFDRTWIGK
ncbi:ABC transporter substrate-binding protein [Paenirhodobacter enshiensis]|uniref:ABC transporter substrate-binding protein n=1 Tax=Paenirhodobacter enshiensis TaxID=1105367 RepID=UPI003FA1D69B